MFELMKKVVSINILKLGISATIFYTLCAFIIYYLEPENFGNPFIGFWWVMTTVTTIGFGDYVPVTYAGKVFGLFLYFTGISLIGIILGKIVDSFSLYRRLKEGGRMNFSGKNHYVLIGWSVKAKKTIDEILRNEHKNNEIVLIDQMGQTPIKHEKIHFISGNPTDPEILNKANILYSNSTTVFAAESEDEAFADGKSLLIASAIESFGKKHHTNIYTIVEVVRQSHIDMFNHVEIDEFVLSNDAFPLLMANSILHHGSSNMFMQLLSKQYGDNIWEIDPASSWDTYRDALEYLQKKGANLLAVGTDLGIMKRLDEKLPNDKELYIICDMDTFQLIKNDNIFKQSSAQEKNPR